MRRGITVESEPGKETHLRTRSQSKEESDE